VRVILVLFLYVEGFAYGELLRHVGAEAAAGAASAAAAAVARRESAAARGFVVYRETVQLMEALEGNSGANVDDGEDE
jgi:hypothetical protein